ncbi:MAG: hypothetical protein PHW01_05270 [Patescibacteria group bacterium]|nr:hypothetical protein [Patescibacteria group bacterium]
MRGIDIDCAIGDKEDGFSYWCDVTIGCNGRLMMVVGIMVWEKRSGKTIATFYGDGIEFRENEIVLTKYGKLLIIFPFNPQTVSCKE